MIQRFGRSEGLASLVLPVIIYLSLAFAILSTMWPYFYYVKNEALIVLGVFSLWRYGWQIVNYCRSAWYGFIRYPRLRKLALNELDETDYPDHIFFVIPSYNEEPWVSIETIQSILSNLTQIPCSATLIIATGSDREDQLITGIYRSHPARHKVSVVFQRQHQGKRIAMGHALRAVARRYKDDYNSVTIFMDGDSYLETRSLNKTIPFFIKFKDLGALTTNEVAYINSQSPWYKDWFNLKFGQRHILFQSHALSNKVLTLTGRFSMFRTEIVVREDFIKQIENDVITHWLHGKFRFLMGDDKSSWFYLLKKQWNMLYIPDVLVYSLESRDADFWHLSTSLPFRWYGNTLRNNARALKLGMKKTGIFIWFSILDQRLSMWTSLVGISGALFLTITKSFVYLPFYLSWVLFVRTIQMSVIAFRGHPVSLLTIPLMLYNQWVGAFIKISAYYRLADQRWSKGKDSQQSSSDRYVIEGTLARILPRLIHGIAYSVFLFALAVAHNSIQAPKVWAFAESSEPQLINAADHGVIANDNRDDSEALNQLLAKYSLGRIKIQLPPGVINLSQPLRITNNNIQLAGSDKSHIKAQFSQSETAVIQITGERKQTFSWNLHASDVGSRTLELQPEQMQLLEGHLAPGRVVSFTMANDDKFISAIGSQVWNEEFPHLRRQLNRVRTVEANRILFDYPIASYFFSGITNFELIEAVSDISIDNLTIEYIVPNAAIKDLQYQYENSFPQHRNSTIALDWTDRIRLTNLKLLNSGNHPIEIENSLACEINGLNVDGAWNKGTGGSGYIKLAKAHYCTLSHLSVKNIRHITLQWGASNNQIKDLYTEVDINFHGGFSHNNRVQDVFFAIPQQHPWPKVYRTPDDAHWAPPDGPNNLVRK